MVGQGRAGLQYRFTIKTFAYMVQVMEVHFEALFQFMKHNGGHWPDNKKHKAAGKDSPARPIFHIGHLVRPFFPGKSIGLVKQPASFHWGLTLKKPIFVDDRMTFFVG